MTPIRNEKHEIVGYRQEQPHGQVKVRDKHGELVGWTAFEETRAKDGTVVSLRGNEAPVYLRPRYAMEGRTGEKKSPDTDEGLPHLSLQKSRG